MILSSPEKIKEYTDKGWWTTVTFDELFRRNVLRSPDKIAIVDPSNRETIMDGEARKLTFSELEAEVNQVASILVKDGVKKDDIVGVQVPNSVEIVIAFLAVMKIGAIISPVPIQYREHELEQVLNHSGASAMITMTNIRGREVAKIMNQLKDELPKMKTVFAWGASVPEDVVSLNLADHVYEIDDLAAYLSEITITANDIFSICWTSGTEGNAKGVPRSQNEWYASSYSTIDLAELTEKDIIMNPFPMVNMAGIGGLFVSWLLTGCKLVQHHPFDIDVFLHQVEKERVTYTMAAPTIMNMLLKDDHLISNYDISSLRIIGSGSAPLSPWLIENWHERFGIQVINFFGSNEGVSLSSGHIEVPDYYQRAKYFPRYGVAGYSWIARSARRMESKLVDLETGETITEPLKPGELRLRGASVFSGYWNDEELTKAAFDKDGFFCSGDVLEIAGDGEEYKFYRMVGRSKDIIIRGGMNISPLEVEGLLEGHPEVSEVALVGIPDEVLGEKACACIVPRNGAEITHGDIISFLKEKKIASYKIPECIELFDQLPRNPIGKVMKHKIKEMLEIQKVE